MDIEIISYGGTSEEDLEIVSLLTRVFVGEGYTDKSIAERIFVPAELRKRGEIMLARSSTSGQLLGMIIFVVPTSSARQVAASNEAEIHLLAVYPEGRSKGVASRLIVACEDKAILSGYPKMVLSTQQTMKDAHRVYERLGYRQNPARSWLQNSTNKVFTVYEKSLQG